MDAMNTLLHRLLLGKWAWLHDFSYPNRTHVACEPSETTTSGDDNTSGFEVVLFQYRVLISRVEILGLTFIYSTWQ
jgi:hypothetical protein